jgi:hypothetical protein
VEKKNSLPDIGVKNMKRFNILVIFILLSACSPQAISVTQIPTSTSIAPTFTNSLTIPRSPTIPSPTKSATLIPSEPTELGFELPPDCSDFNPSIGDYYYHDLSNGACNYPALSPDGSFIAYASYKITEAGEIIQEARLFSRSLNQALPIYESECGALYSEWTPTGYLVISDFPQDVGCGYTVIYNIAKGKIIATLDGAVYRNGRNYWSTNKNSFFTLSPEVLGPVCSETLSGFDFNSNKLIPVIKPITPNTDIYLVVGNPIWSPDNKILFAVIRDGSCSAE